MQSPLESNNYFHTAGLERQIFNTKLDTIFIVMIDNYKEL